MARRQQQADRAMRSPGRPIPARHVERAFWRLIAQGKRTEEAASEIGVSVPVASRWFRHAGGMPPLSLAEPTGRYLSFHEREEIAVLRARASVSGRSPVGWVAIPARSRESCGATPPRAAGNATTEHRSRNGRRRPQPADRSSLPTLT